MTRQIDKWNPRYRAYTEASGRTPEEQLEHDTEEYPGGCMAGFLIWISNQWSLWWTQNKHRFPNAHGRNDVILRDEDYRSFDEMLGIKVVPWIPIPDPGLRGCERFHRVIPILSWRALGEGADLSPYRPVEHRQIYATGRYDLTTLGTWSGWVDADGSCRDDAPPEPEVTTWTKIEIEGENP